MAYQHTFKYRRQLVVICSLLGGLNSLWMPATSLAQSNETTVSAIQVTVNNAEDDPIRADADLTLREAIALINGTLLFSELSAQEQQLVMPAREVSTIRFDLPIGQTAIALNSILPAIARPNTT
ncbi:hypothetical protein IQ256_25885, partial [cf. Phormidesmis sp. LEGE 11477]|nr:hypothetical protein [cf. Phormidesmis sp. LEGE 11477]